MSRESKYRKVNFTVAEKILLQLLDYGRYENEYFVPFDITQMGLAKTIRADRTAVSKNLKKLKEQNYIFDRLAHGEGIKRKRKVYFMTEPGVTLALEIKKYVQDIPITLKKMDEKTLEMRICDVKDHIESKPSLVEILSNLSQDFVFDVKSLEKEEPSEKIIPLEVQLPPIVGRDKELEQLQEYLSDALDKNGRLVFLAGEAGIGKTRLVQELKNLTRDKNIYFLIGNALYQKDVDPYRPFVDAFQEYFNIVDPNVGKARIKEVQKVSSKFAELLSTDIKDEDHRKVISKESTINLSNEKTRIFDTVSKLIINISKEKPVILCLEDLHWADEGSIYLLYYLARNMQQTSMLILGTYRPEELIPMEKEPHHLTEVLQRMNREKLFTTMDIQTLTQDDVSKMISSLLDKEEIPESFVKLIFKETQGNPFFVEEVVGSLLEDGLIDLDDKEWHLKLDSSKLKIPSTIKDVIMRRINRLDKDGIKVIEYAATIGDEFEIDVLSRSTGMEDEKLLDTMDELTEAKLIYEDLVSEDEIYRFGHAKIRDVTYERLSKFKKRHIHESVGNSLEELNKDNLDEAIHDLAYHFSKTKEYAKSFNYSVKAGDKTWSLYAATEALTYYKSALKALEVLEKEKKPTHKEWKMDVTAKIGNVYELLGKWDDALQHYLIALNCSEELDDAIKKAELSRNIGNVHEKRGEYDKALSRYEFSLSYIKEKADKIETAKIYNSIGVVYWRKGEYDKAIEYCRKALKIAEQYSDRKEQAHAFNNIGLIFDVKGDYDTALENYEKSLELREEIGDLRGLAMSYNNIGTIYDYKGNYDKALEYHKKSLEIKKGMGDMRGSAASYNNLGIIYDYKGDYNEALIYYEKSLEIREMIGDQEGILMSYDNLGAVYYDKGEYDKAYEYFKKSLDICNNIGNKHLLPHCYCWLAKIHVKKGMLKKALEFCNPAFDLAKESEDKECLGHSLRIFGMIYGEQENWNLSVENFEKSINTLKEIGLKAEIGTSYYEYGLMWKKKGDTDKTKECLKNAMQIFKELGAKRDLEMTKKAIEDT